MEDLIKDDEVYEIIVHKHNNHTPIILKALEEVANYIKQKQHILVGGQAINYALRMKGELMMYSEAEVPDYDIVTPTFHKDAYELANLLSLKGFTCISVINALHPSTMRVRINFIVVCDITYMPKNLYDSIPTLFYDEFRIVHPGFQVIDQHLALSRPYDSAPRYTIMYRFEKDIKRHDLLMKYYDFALPEQADVSKDLADPTLTSCSIRIKTDILMHNCIGGFAAMIYWLGEAQRLGFTGGTRLTTKNKISEDFCSLDIPHGFYGFTVLSDDFESVIQAIEAYLRSESNNSTTFTLQYKNDIGGKIARRILMHKTASKTDLDTDSNATSDRKKIYPDFEIHDVLGKLICATKPWSKPIWICNLQYVQCYAATFIWMFNPKYPQRVALYYNLYNICNDIVTWASQQYVDDAEHRELYKPFLPNGSVYGESNWSERYVFQHLEDDAMRNSKKDNPKAWLPQTAFLNDGELMDSDDVKMKYDPTQVEIMQFNGKNTKKFTSLKLIT